jgi:deoxyribodipyrimidine photo-lyase
VDLRRVRELKTIEQKDRGPVIYWMSHDQRAHDNWALVYASELARESNSDLEVVFCQVPEFLNAQELHYNLMLDGLKEVGRELNEKSINFTLHKGKPEKIIPKACGGASALVTDFDPLKIKQKWKEAVAKKIDIPLYEVDAHNVVPVWEASDKKEFAAYTLRPKITKKLPQFLTEFPKEWRGSHPAIKDFIKNRLDGYDVKRNDPNLDGQSGLSPYLHFGQISAQRVALEVKRAKGMPNDVDTFIEELIIRRELSDNFCFYEKNYDNSRGFPDWAKKTLNEHRRDKREYIYTTKELEDAKTHDDLWNAAQREMTRTNKMHGYMRMYWAKKILEWSETPEKAQKAAIFLNDKYELDGRDPNGYTGVAWSIGGVHDRAWPERKVFGKIRYMNLNGAKRKFNVKEYISRNNG